MAGAVALLLLMDAYTIREIRNLRAEIAVAARSVLPEAAKPRPKAAAARHQVAATTRTASTARPAYDLASNSEIARGYSIGSAETRNLPGR